MFRAVALFRSKIAMSHTNFLRLICLFLAVNSAATGLMQLQHIRILKRTIDIELATIRKQNDALRNASAAMSMMRFQLEACQGRDKHTQQMKVDYAMEAPHDLLRTDNSRNGD